MSSHQVNVDPSMLQQFKDHEAVFPSAFGFNYDSSSSDESDEESSAVSSSIDSDVDGDITFSLNNPADLVSVLALIDYGDSDSEDYRQHADDIAHSHHGPYENEEYYMEIPQVDDLSAGDIMHALLPLGTILNTFPSYAVIRSIHATGSLLSSSDDESDSHGKSPAGRDGRMPLTSPQELEPIMLPEIQTTIYNARGQGIGRVIDIFGGVKCPFYVIGFHNEVVQPMPRQAHPTGDVQPPPQSPSPDNQPMESLTNANDQATTPIAQYQQEQIPSPLQTVPSEQPASGEDGMKDHEPTSDKHSGFAENDHDDDDDDDQMIAVYSIQDETSRGNNDNDSESESESDMDLKPQGKARRLHVTNPNKTASRTKLILKTLPIPSLSAMETVYYHPALSRRISAKTYFSPGIDIADDELDSENIAFSDDEKEHEYNRRNKLQGELGDNGQYEAAEQRPAPFKTKSKPQNKPTSTKPKRQPYQQQQHRTTATLVPPPPPPPLQPPSQMMSPAEHQLQMLCIQQQQQLEAYQLHIQALKQMNQSGNGGPMPPPF